MWTTRVVLALAMGTVLTSCQESPPVSTSSPTPPASAVTSPTPGQPVAGVLITPSAPIFLPTDASLSAPSSNVVWAVIENSYLYRSTDRGSTWQQRPLPPHAGGGNGPEIAFVDDHQGWVFYGGVPATQCTFAGAEVWRTTDGGGTWTQVVAVDPQQQPASSIGFAQCKQGLSFSDPTHGFLGADDPNTAPTIYRTADSGLTWAPSRLSDPPGFVSQGAGDTLQAGHVKGFNGTLLLQAWGMQPGAQAETNFVFQSTDGGATWHYVATAGNGIEPITFVTQTRWLQIGNNRSALETADAGRTWHSYPSGYDDAAGVASVFVFGDNLTGYGTVRGGIQRTVDGGLHWVMIRTPGAYQPS